MTDSLSWESWEEWDELNHCFLLYVVGEISTSNTCHQLILVKKDLPGLPSSNLLLELVPSPTQSLQRHQELIYTEAPGKNNYDCITIFFGHRVITEISEIEKADRETESWNDDLRDEIK